MDQQEMESLLDHQDWKEIVIGVKSFAHAQGRNPRILISKMGQDGHDRGAKVIATGFADAGFDVDLSPIFSNPKDIAKQALENDVHTIGISSLAGAHKTLVLNLLAALNSQGSNDILVFLGGIVPNCDHKQLLDAGVKAIFGPSTPVYECVDNVLEYLNANNNSV